MGERSRSQEKTDKIKNTVTLGIRGVYTTIIASQFRIIEHI